jgi:hypothetical protein
MVGKTFSSRPARALRSKGFSVARICEMVFPLRKTLFAVFPVSSFASERQRLMLSGLMPTSMPVKVLPMVVVTMTVLSTNAAISVKYFLCANDKFLTPLLLYEIALRLFIFNTVGCGFDVCWSALFVLLLGVSTCFGCFWLLLGLVSWFCLCLGLGVVVVVDWLLQRLC